VDRFYRIIIRRVMLWVVSISYTFWFGLGAWGLNKTVGWAWDITGFVWWVGIGHAGTLISAVLLIFRQNWRNSINRSAEAMTIFAVICAATYIVAHMGRPWLAYFTLPLPNQYGSLMGKLELGTDDGRVRDINLLLGIIIILVHRFIARYRFNT
jgi:Ni/Fe-hydrogenase subunit HybB-like protein